MILGWEILIRWLVAAVVLSIFFGTVGYVVTYAIQKKRRMKAAQDLGLSWDEYLEILKQDSAERNS
jgi:ABC-type spermidine/putrescine transport system permease subunit II